MTSAESVRGTSGRHFVKRLRVARELRGESLARRRPGEGRGACQQFVSEKPNRVDVDAVIRGRVASELFRCHVRGRADRDARRRDAADRHGGAERFRDAEVGDERVRPLAQDVARLDVAVDDASRVSERERVDHVVHDARDFADAERLLPLERRAERLAVDERHRVPEEVALLAGGQERHDVRVVELGGDLNFAAEALSIDAGREVGREHLDDDLSAEGAVDRYEHSAHAAAGELGLELVAGAERGLQLFREVGHLVLRKSHTQ